ncbi:MAG: ABC transporter ATP-binding protein [Desulfosarcinaceae bacterium]|nr:ABC transporter ATP-binding protein [Desulfosarcinaceae bacterium]
MQTTTTSAAPPDSERSIQARDLTRIYRVGSVSVTGIEGVNLSVPAGQMVVLKGESGSGKSTLLSLLAGLDRLTHGALTVAGRDLSAPSDTELTTFRRHAVGMVFQAFNLLPTLTVLENACLPALLAGANPDTAHTKASDLLSWLGLNDRLDHRPSQLSGGEMQRTAIARALINDPGIILADEPTGNLDSHNARKVIALLADLNREFDRTVVVATHSDLVDPFATMVLALQDGRVAS